jgi:hypothetical protein
MIVQVYDDTETGTRSMEMVTEPETGKFIPARRGFGLARAESARTGRAGRATAQANYRSSAIRGRRATLGV